MPAIELDTFLERPRLENIKIAVKDDPHKNIKPHNNVPRTGGMPKKYTIPIKKPQAGPVDPPDGASSRKLH